MTTKHETKHCPRCNKVFECKVSSILLCQCQTVALSAEQLEHISFQYDDCLCAACLVEVRSEYNQQQHEKKIQQFCVR